MINWYFDKILLESFEHMGEGKTIYEALVNKFYYIQKEKLFFKAAFRTDEQNCLIQHDFELIFDFYSRRIESNTGQPVSEHLGFLLEMYCYGSIYMTVPIVMEYNAEYTGEKYREIARVMGVKGVDDMSVEEYRKAAVDAVQKLSIDVGIPTKLEALKEEDLDFLAESAHADACAPGNPKDASVEDLKALFRKLM